MDLEQAAAARRKAGPRVVTEKQMANLKRGNAVRWEFGHDEKSTANRKIMRLYSADHTRMETLEQRLALD